MSVVAGLLQVEKKECYGSQGFRSGEYLQRIDHCGRKLQMLVFHLAKTVP
jgi:hypothetical protein